MNHKTGRLILILFLLLTSGVFAGNPVKHHIIIDTDCAPDDLRAINLLLSSYEVEVLAMTSEDGTLDPEDGYLRINTLLNELGHQGIPSTQGIITKNAPPPWHELAKTLKWGEEIISYDQPTEVKEFLIKTIEDEEEPVEIICLGPLTNIANAILMKPGIKQEIKRIIWFDQCLNDTEWTNYGMDCLSADYVLKTGIPVYRIKAGESPILFDKKLYQSIGEINTPYARNIFQSHSSDSIQKRMKEDHLKLWDDLAALYLFYPNLFQRDTVYADSSGNVMKVKEPKQIKNAILEHLKLYNIQGNIIFSRFPTDTSFFKTDIQHLTDTLIKFHGLREWKAITLTNEIHNHLGLYSIVGAKMGIRAREYFHTTSDHLNIKSFAGYEPPLSCFNDGLQIGSGCTIGNGSFSIQKDETEPEATVVFNDQKINIHLKTDFYNKIQRTIIKNKNIHGMGSKEYWEAIRKEGIKIWKNFNRREIFEIREVY
jgi:pyrimidine-specific ribonucleoside hydrolase